MDVGENTSKENDRLRSTLRQRCGAAWGRVDYWVRQP